MVTKKQKHSWILGEGWLQTAEADSFVLAEITFLRAVILIIVRPII